MKVADLLDCVSVLMPAVDTKGLVKEFTLLNFAPDEGKLYSTIEATDGTMFVQVRFEEVLPPFAIDADMFFNVAKTLRGKEMTISIADNLVMLKAGRVTGKFPVCAPPANRPNFVVQAWHEMPSSLFDAIALCRLTACSDQTAGALTGVYVEESTVLSSDRFRVSCFTLDLPLAFKQSFVVPVAVIDHIMKYRSTITHFAVEGDSIYFKTPQAIIGCKLLQGEYPAATLLNALASVPMTDAQLTLTSEFKAQLAEAAARQNIVQDDALEFDRESQFAYDNGKVTISTLGKTISMEDVLEVQASAPAAFSFLINPVFLLKATEEADKLTYATDAAMILFSSSRFLHLVGAKTKAS